jgi:hypothetical protein
MQLRARIIAVEMAVILSSLYESLAWLLTWRQYFAHNSLSPQDLGTAKIFNTGIATQNLLICMLIIQTKWTE